VLKGWKPAESEREAAGGKERTMNEMFVDARMRDWDATAEAIAFERRVLRILAAPVATRRSTEAVEASRETADQLAA